MSRLRLSPIVGVLVLVPPLFAASLSITMCPVGFEAFGSYCFHSNGGYNYAGGYNYTYDSSLAYCTNISATLPYPTDDLENWQSALGQMFDHWTRGTGPVSGATQQQSDGLWYWPDGTEVEQAAWWDGQQPSQSIDACSRIATGTNKLYGDIFCNDTRPVTCQAEATTTTVPTQTTTSQTLTTTTGEDISCYSCLGCPDVDANSSLIPKYEEQSCFTAIYDNKDNVVRGVSLELHIDGECQFDNGVAVCYCNKDKCNGIHARENRK